MSSYYSIQSSVVKSSTNIVQNSLIIGNSGASIFYTSTGISFNQSLVPTANNINLGSLDNPWKSLYVSTGTVFIGPTGAMQINNNGLISSSVGFASPYYQVGSINPGDGILLYEDNNSLYYQTNNGASGPVGIFQVATNGINNFYHTGGNIGIGTSSPSCALEIAGTVCATTFTGTNAHFSNLTATTYTGTNVYITNINATGGVFDYVSTVSLTGINSHFQNSHVINTLQIGSSNVGTIYFSTGSKTGCFVESLRNATGSSSLIYNPNSKEITYTTPNYLYTYFTGSQTPSATSYTGVQFNQTPILDGFTQSSSRTFSFTADTNGIYQISYSLQVHSTNNASETLNAYIELDGTPISGSARSIVLTGSTTNETTLSHLVLTHISSGFHTIQIMCQSSNATRISLANPANIITPGLSGSAATLTVHRII